jgi:ferritin
MPEPEKFDTTKNTFHIYLHHVDEGQTETNRLLNLILSRQKTGQEKLMAVLQDLVDEVTAETTVKDSVLALIDRLVANQSNPAALDALLTSMKANKDAIAAAVTANTPAAPTP